MKQHNPDCINKWLASYLTSREQMVDFKGIISSSAKITIGVPQGSILGSLLFLLQVSDLPFRISSKEAILLSHSRTAEDATSDIQGNLNPRRSMITLKHCLLPHSCKWNGVTFFKTNKVVPVGDLVDLRINSLNFD